MDWLYSLNHHKGFHSLLSLFILGLVNGQMQANARSEEVIRAYKEGPQVSRIGARNAICIYTSTSPDQENWEFTIPQDCQVKVVDSAIKRIAIWQDRTEVIRNGKSIYRTAAGGRDQGQWEIEVSGKCLQAGCMFTDYGGYGDSDTRKLLYFSSEKILLRLAWNLWIIFK
jgi:hypothetical protein